MVRSGRSPRTGVAMLVAALLLPPAAQPAHAAEVSGYFMVRFHGASTLHGFDGRAPAQPFRAATAAASLDAWNAELQLPVRSLDTGIGLRDRNMRRMLDVASFPMIRASLHGVDPHSWSQATAARPGRLRFALTMHGLTRQVEATVSHWQADGGEYSFDIDFPVSLRKWGLTPPAILFIHVRDAVAVRVHVVAHRDR